MASSRPIDAKKIIDQALKINPDSIQLLCNIAGYYLLEKNEEKALEYASKAYIANPEFVDALKLMAKIHYHHAEYDDALAFYRKAYAISNEDEITCYIAQILERRGEFDEANKLITPLIEAGKTDIATLLIYSALSRKFKNERIAIKAIETKINNTSLDRASLISLHSELGKQYDLLGEYDEAFKNYKTANLLEREKNKQIGEHHKERVLDNTKKEDIERWYSDYPKEFWRNLPCSNNDSERPILLSACFVQVQHYANKFYLATRTFMALENCMTSHQISYRIKNTKLHDKSPASLINVTQNTLAGAASSYLKTLERHSTTAKRVVDKMPANSIHVGLISKLFPNAHIVHMIRDPRDTCLSMYFQTLVHK